MGLAPSVFCFKDGPLYGTSVTIKETDMKKRVLILLLAAAAAATIGAEPIPLSLLNKPRDMP